MDLDELEGWAEKWQTWFYTDKCKIINTGKGNPYQDYLLNGKALGKTDKERDLVIFVAATSNKQLLQRQIRMGWIKRGMEAYDENFTTVQITSQTPHGILCTDDPCKKINKKKCRTWRFKVINEMGGPSYPKIMKISYLLWKKNPAKKGY